MYYKQIGIALYGFASLRISLVGLNSVFLTMGRRDSVLYCGADSK